MKEYILEISWEKENSNHIDDLIEASKRAVKERGRQFNDEKEELKDLLKRKKILVRSILKRKGRNKNK